jgi:hypothetical protein
MYFNKNTKNYDNLTTTEAREKYFESLEFKKFFNAFLTKIRTIKFYLIKLVSISIDNSAIYWVKHSHILWLQAQL